MSKELCCVCKKGYLSWDRKTRKYVCDKCGEIYFASNLQELVEHFQATGE